MSLPPRFVWRVGMTPDNQCATLLYAQKHGLVLHIVYRRNSNRIATLGADAADYTRPGKPLEWRDRATVLAVYPGSPVEVKVCRSKGNVATLKANQIMEATEWQSQKQSA